MRVLVVEDEVRLAAAIERGLVAEGFQVDVVHDGLDGLWRAREFVYGAIVLDLLLPGMNGFRVCRTLREEGVATPILVLTAKDGEYDEAESLDIGADDFLSKPFSFVVLVARLRALARRGGQPPRRVLEVGGLVLDPVGRRCTRDGVEIPLTPREFAVLEALMRRAGDVVPKAQLLDDVWGADFGGDANVVEVFVGHLRRRIDRPFGCRTLQTVRGSGYRIVSDRDARAS
ncbi:MAG TPA: response regulator transcription factor [Acidimicrobiia bacterium]|nr:response regulator transcription factor [Acidimicrobiia bacterium]